MVAAAETAATMLEESFGKCSPRTERCFAESLKHLRQLPATPNSSLARRSTRCRVAGSENVAG
eukprot:CAMPEP_0183454280 /NCGR_PEP_ID=MMETSP0370-20130417/123551_1 /TAXON_ID=268820 /ORGANISM="Peridinium aciculiferum, Strain PAER-2" /LENGTH=62 /DNA_ID=CAMNT_0025645771 /DNA_START=40 /DNA_END=224 /DNA_ORIENTATION=-